MQKNDEDQGPTELLERPREYSVKFRFPETSKLQPPILGLYETDFNYPGQAPLFKGVDFGIDMESRIAIVGECNNLQENLAQLLQFDDIYSNRLLLYNSPNWLFLFYLAD